MRNIIFILCLCDTAALFGSISISGSQATPPASITQVLDQRIGSTYQAVTFDLSSLSDSIITNLPDARLSLTIGSNTWDLVLNAYELRATEFVIGTPYSYSGTLYGNSSSDVRMYISPRLIRGLIFDGFNTYRVIHITEYGDEFVGYNYYILTQTSEVPYEYQPEEGDCENPVIVVGVDGDYEYYLKQDSNVELAKDRILAAFLEIDYIYFTNFRVSLKIVGPYIRTQQDGLSGTIIDIQLKLSTLWQFQRPCLDIDYAFLISGKNLAGAGMATGSSCPSGFPFIDYMVAYIVWRGPLQLPVGGVLPGWFIALAHEMGHLLGANEDDDTACASQCNNPNCMPPIMCQSGCNSPEFIYFSSCSRSAIQNGINVRCNTCYSEPPPPSECAICVETFYITADKSVPLVPYCDYHNEIEISFQFTNDCDPEEIQFGFTFNPQVIEITDIGDYDDIVTFSGNPELDYIVKDPYNFDGEELIVLKFKAKLIGAQYAHGTTSTRFTLRRNDQLITPSSNRITHIDVLYISPVHIEGEVDISDILDIGSPPTIWSTNTAGCIETNPPVRIDGTLHFDTDFCLKGSYVIMEPGARIVVDEGVNLTLDADYIFGCDELWDYILLEEDASLEVWNCTIEDAEYAIKFLEGASVYVRNTDFKNNYVSIYAPHGYKGRSVNISRDVHFSQTRPLKSTSQEDALAGILLNDVQGASINGGLIYQIPLEPLKSTNLITFENLQNGILLNHSDAFIGGVSFSNVNRGISAISDGTNTLRIDGGLHKEVFFHECGLAINAENINLSVKRSTLGDVRHRIWVRPFGNYNLDISDNFIRAKSSGITIAYPYEVQGTINDNLLWVSEYESSPGIGISAHAVRGALEISDNRVYIDGGRTGISFLRTEGVALHSNEVLIFNTDASEPRGIEIKDSRMCIVNCNTVIADNIEADIWGIHIQDSPDMLYSCNTTDNLTHNIQFHGMCTGSDLRANPLGSGNAGLELGSAAFGSEAIIGVQDHRGNLWNTTYDWKGAWHYSSAQDVIDLSLFRARSNAILNPPNVSELISLGWFVMQFQGDTYECEPQTDCTGDASQIHDEDISLLDEIGFGEVSGTKNWLKERQIFYRLYTGMVNPASAQELSAFYSGSYNKTLGVQVQLEHRLGEALRITGQDSSDRADYLMDRHALLDSLYTLGILLAEADSAAAVGILADARSIVTEFETQHSSDSHWSTGYATSLASDLSDIAEDNGDIEAEEDYEEYDQTVLNILLTSMDGGVLDISTADSATLLDIASLCVYAGGPGVYHARAVYALIVPGMIFDDHDICGTVQPRSAYREYIPVEEVHEDYFRVIPNPAQNEIRIEYAGAVIPDHIRITTISGAEILFSRISSSRFDISALSDGIYFIQLLAGREILGSTRLVIIR